MCARWCARISSIGQGAPRLRAPWLPENGARTAAAELLRLVSLAGEHVDHPSRPRFPTRSSRAASRRAAARATAGVGARSSVLGVGRLLAREREHDLALAVDRSIALAYGRDTREVRGLVDAVARGLALGVRRPTRAPMFCAAALAYARHARPR